MTRNLKALGLALVAICAMSAIAASGASAAGEQFHAEQPSVFITGHSHEPVLRVGPDSTTTGTEVVCETGTYEGTVTGEGTPPNETTTTKQVTVHPTYDGPCEIPGIGAFTIDTHGCDFTLTSEYDIGGHAGVGVECTTGSAIRITSGLCEITITPFAHNTVNDGARYTNLPNGTITVDVTADLVPYHKTGPFCFLVAGNGHDGFYEDDVVVQATSYSGASMNATTHTWTVTEIAEVDITHG